MRTFLAIALIGSLILSHFASPALAGDPHAVWNRWTGAAIGAGVATLGGLLLGPVWGPSLAEAAPPVVAPPPPVVYARPPVVEYRTWFPGHDENRWVAAIRRQRVWVPDHFEQGWRIPGHWEERVRDGGYWTRVWVEGYWR